MALDIRVWTRSDLNTLLRLFDEQCLAQFNGQQLTKKQRAAARSALLSLRDSVHNKIVKQVIIQDEIPQSQLPKQRLDVELQQAVDDLETQSIQLQNQLEQARSEGIEQFEKENRDNLLRPIQIDDEVDLGLPSCSKQRCPLPSDSDISRVKRILRESDQIAKRNDKIVNSGSIGLNDLSKVCQEKVMASASKEKSIEFEKAFDENCDTENLIDNDQPVSKRQRYGPNFTTRFK